MQSRHPNPNATFVTKANKNSSSKQKNKKEIQKTKIKQKKKQKTKIPNSQGRVSKINPRTYVFVCRKGPPLIQVLEQVG
jgi:U3 small nucleolar RNA-associated protein 14